mgnify:CR=1 FL=1
MKNLTYIKNLLLDKYDLSTESGRGKTRLKLALLASVSTGVSKFISLLVIVATVRWGISYLGEERYGLWMTITAMITLMSLADLGINNSLVNLASNSSGKDDVLSIRKGIANAIAGLTSMAFIILIISFIIFSGLDWTSIFNLKSQLAIDEAGISVIVFASIFALSLPTAIVQKVLVGLQKGWQANIWIILGQSLGIMALWIAIQNESSLPVLILSLAGPPLIANIFCTMFFFIQNSHFIPRINDISEEGLRKLLSSGGLFFLIQIMSLLGSATDNLIIANQLGVTFVSEFSVVQRLAMMLGIAQLFIAPLWPAFGESLSRGDFKWAKKTFYKALSISILASLIGGVVLMVAGNLIINAWTDNYISPNIYLLAGFSFHIILASFGGCLSVLLNNAELLRKQALIFFVASIVSILLKFVFVGYFQAASGAIFGTVIGYGLFYVIPGMALVRAYFQENIVN